LDRGLLIWRLGRTLSSSVYEEEGCLMSDPMPVRMSGPLSVFEPGFRQELFGVCPMFCVGSG
jgi:hypothetical protein